MHYFLVNKPYGVLSQFTREESHHRTLADLFSFPKQVYPVGRLDRDSEGLLLVTDDKAVNQKLLHPRHAHRRVYWVQVEGAVGPPALTALRAGPTINLKGLPHTSLPVGVTFGAPALPPRDPPIRVRKMVPDTWLALTLTEGKNRQVRRMCAVVGHPVLRLVRYAIEGVTLEDVGEGPVKKVSREWLYARLGI